MKRLTLMLLILFTSPWLRALVDLPEACYLKSSLPCSFRASSDGDVISWHYETYSLELTASKGAAWTLSANGLQLLEGMLWLRKVKNLTLFRNQMPLHLNGDFFISQYLQDGENRLEIKNLSGTVTGQIGQQQLVIPVGFENWIGEMGSEKVPRLGILRPIVTAKFIPLWIKKMRVNSAASRSYVSEWKLQWAGSADESSALYADIVQRNIATTEARQKSQQEKSKRAQQERLQLRNLFRQKNSGY